MTPPPTTCCLTEAQGRNPGMSPPSGRQPAALTHTLYHQELSCCDILVQGFIQRPQTVIIFIIDEYVDCFLNVLMNHFI